MWPPVLDDLLRPKDQFFHVTTLCMAVPCKFIESPLDPCKTGGRCSLSSLHTARRAALQAADLQFRQSFPYKECFFYHPLWVSAHFLHCASSMCDGGGPRYAPRILHIMILHRAQPFFSWKAVVNAGRWPKLRWRQNTFLSVELQENLIQTVLQCSRLRGLVLPCSSCSAGLMVLLHHRPKYRDISYYFM